MAIFNPNRKQGGTIELVRDAQGNYTTKEVGFNTLSSLSIPDFKTTITPTTTTTDDKTATDITGDTIDTQTQMAFRMPERDDNNILDTTGDMLQKSAEETSEALRDTFSTTRALMTSDDAYKGVTSPLEIKDPTEKFSTARKEMTQDEAYRQGIEDFKNYQDAILRGQVGTKAVDRNLKGSAAVQRGEADPPGINFDFLKGDRFKQGTAFTDATTRQAMTTDEAMRGDAMTQEGTAFARPARGTIDQMAADSLGISTAKPTDTALDTARFAGVSKMGTLADKDVKDVKPVKRNALETVSTSLRTTGDSILNKIKTPTMMLLDAIVGPETASDKFDKKYFNVREDGRIAGNPATDLYAGMNNISMFGNKVQSGKDRIARREETIEKKGYKPGDKFYDNTQKMKEQQKNYLEERNNDPGINPSKAVTVSRTDKDFGQFGRKQQSDAAGGGGGKSKIVCTMMNESYGFGSFRNKIWLRHSKNLAPEYQIGYHRIFLPLVKKAKTNKVLKKILEHIAIHRTIDIRQEERNKIHLLGRVYRTILEPICYWVGKI